MLLIKHLINIRRGYKKIITSVFDTVSILISFSLSISLVHDSLHQLTSIKILSLALFLILISPTIFYLLGLYKAVLRYFSNNLLLKLAVGNLIITVVLKTSSLIIGYELTLLNLFVFYTSSLILTSGIRLLFSSLINTKIRNCGEPVIIYGAGAAGRQSAIALQESSEFKPVAFVDDDPALQDTFIQGIYVFSSASIPKLIEESETDKILLAMPSISQSIKQSIISKLDTLPVTVLTLPSMPELISGEKHYSDVKEIEIEDLLGREIIPPRIDLMSKNITAKNILISGAGGSIGSELCRQVLKQSPNKLILFELSEFNLYQIEKELSEIKKQLNLNTIIYPILGSVQDKNLLNEIMVTFSIQTVYHAAAYKHVPLVEYNVIEGAKNNILGTLNIVTAAIDADIETFVLISTDKAVRPTNIMGATKRLAEMILQALSAQLKQKKIIISMVRFGNVLGSSGSVVPLFKQQIKKGGPVTITHKEITRFFMTIPEASQLVIQAGAMGKGGDVFVLDMGSSVKIYDLACRMIKLSGLSLKNEVKPNGDIEIAYTGLRPGEKLFEELLIGENVNKTAHERIMTANEDFLSWDEISILLESIKKACAQHNSKEIQKILLSAKTGYNPTTALCDLLAIEKLDN
ncbi:polysaccharide biosynthesis protein [Providencia rettgeri]|nr:polysaccharide biosynthesis protein [Providencia rettgeri]